MAAANVSGVIGIQGDRDVEDDFPKLEGTCAYRSTTTFGAMIRAVSGSRDWSVIGHRQLDGCGREKVEAGRSKRTQVRANS
jgi:hypothetical protein